jgi:gamma-glutamyltranspeptidase/glutathione hydrolase
MMFQKGGTPSTRRAPMLQALNIPENAERASGPINAIYFDRKHRTLWGGSSHHREDYEIAW